MMVMAQILWISCNIAKKHLGDLGLNQINNKWYLHNKICLKKSWILSKKQFNRL